MTRRKNYPVTPDGRYFVVRERLWRTTNPHLDEDLRSRLVKELMDARRDVKLALRRDDKSAETSARERVHHAKVALGERGEVWWPGDEGDFNQHLVKNTLYASWFSRLKED